VVTSGDSERFFFYKGKRYSHIINPKTGYPADLSRSVTVIAKKAYFADALATGVFIMGPEKGLALIESLEGVDGMIIDARGNVHVSKGLQKKVKDSDKTLKLSGRDSR